MYNTVRSASLVLLISLLSTFCSPVFSGHIRRPRRVSTDLTSPVTDQIHDESDTQTVRTMIQRNDIGAHEIIPTAYSPRHEQYQFSSLQPSPFQHQSDQREANILHGHRAYPTEKTGPIHTSQKSKLAPEYNYILTASGKENIYTPNKPFAPLTHRPHELQFISEGADPSKNYKKFKYAYNLRPEGGHEAREDEHEIRHIETSFFVPPTKSVEKIDVYPPRSTSWKQLGPNVEISSAAEHPVYPPKKVIETALPEHKILKKRKNTPKMARQGYMSQQHALYVANNLQNLQALKAGAFDHNSMLRQSDKFDISDALFQEQEEAKKTAEGQVRTKQESPTFHADYSPGQYFQQVALNAAAPAETPYPTKFQPYHMHTYGKGFIRNIEVETSPSGAKQSVPALIIPLTPDQVNNPFFGNEFGVYVNQPDILNPIVKSRHVQVAQPFPYDIVRNDYYQQSIQQQPGNYPYYQPALPILATPTHFRTPEEAYNAFLNHQNQYYRVPYNLNSASTTPTNVDDKSSPAQRQQLEIQSPPYSPPVPKRNHKYQRQSNHRSQHHSHRPQETNSNELKKDYLFESEKNGDFITPSESSSYLSTVSSTEMKNANEAEKPDTTT